MGFIRLVVFGFIGLSVIYVCVSFYSGSVRREKLEDEWDENQAAGANQPARDTYIEKGMVEYFNGFRRKLIVLIYIVPAVAVATILYLTNSN
ncbi:MAG: hypothetical protein JKX69_07025 [Rhodobacteraceae bacterium]|nr:hypothetical protein [Paracoccaceae bacterium]